jgi:hypothetical protein
MAKEGKDAAERVPLWAAFAAVPDPRDASGKRHPLQAVLTLASVAVLSGARSLYAVAQFGRDRGEECARALGFTRDVPPCRAMLFNLFRDLDRAAFEAAAIDGKALRGTQGHEVPGVHVLAGEG